MILMLRHRCHQCFEAAYQLVPQSGFIFDVLADHLDEGIVLKFAPNLFKIEIPLPGRTVHTESDTGNHRKFFAGIVIEHSVERHNGFVPLPYDSDNISGGQPVDCFPYQRGIIEQTHVHSMS